MPNYRILGSMTQYYEFNIEADSEQEAIDEVRRIENTQSVDDYQVVGDRIVYSIKQDKELSVEVVE